MRKLAVSAFCFAVAIFISRYLLPFDMLLLCSAVAAAASLAGLFFRGNMRLRVFIVFLSIAAGFAWSFAYSSVFVKPHWDLHDEIATVTVIITDHPVERHPRGYRVDAEIKRDNLPSIGARLYYFNENNLKPGDTAEISARFRRTDITQDGDRFDALSSRGLFLSAHVSGEFNIISSDNGFRFLPRRISDNIAQKIDELYPDDISHFMQALLTGKRDELFNDTSLSASLSASGIIHIVSISGMHIAFLMGFLSLIIRNRRLFSFYAIPILLFFMAMTGFTPAVTRAGIMQIFLLCAPMFRRESDSITSLSAALMAILLFNPYSSASIGLHLSFSATLGIILFTSKINNAVTHSLYRTKIRKIKLLRAVSNFIISSLSTTIGALIFTLPLTAIHFGYVSLIAPLTNLLTLGAVSLAFPLGLISVLLSFMHNTLGAVFAYPVTFAARYIIQVASSLASIPYGIVYSSNAHIMLWLAYIYVMFIALPLLKARLRQYLYPGCIALILLFIIILVSPLLPGITDTCSVTVLDVGQGLSVVVSSDGHTMVVDCGSLSLRNPGEIAHEFLMNLGRTAIDIFAITHFHEDHINGIEFLFSRITVFTLLLPERENCLVSASIIELASSNGTDIVFVTETLNISFGDMNMFVYPPLGEGGENERGLSVLMLGNVTALITGDMNKATERRLLRYAALPKLDLLVVGHHGSRHSTSEELLEALLPDIAVIPVGRNSFGHPSPEVLERLEKYSVRTYRSDLDGHVTIGKVR